VHITGEFDNRPGTGRFLRIFSCVVTYRTGAGRRLYVKTSMPDFTRIFNDEYIYIKMHHHSSKKQQQQVVKIRKIAADSDSDGDENHTC